MSGQPSSAQGQPLKGGRGGVKIYLHAVTDEQAEQLTDTVNTRPLEEIKKNTGAGVEFDPNPSPVPGMKILIIRGLPTEIEAAVRLISQKTGLKEALPDQAQTFWLQWVEAAFPDLDSRAYFLPPVYVNRVPMTRQAAAGQSVLVLEPAPGQAGQSNQGLTSSSSAESAAGYQVQVLQLASRQAGQSNQGLTSSPSAESAAGHQVQVLQLACGHHVLVLELACRQTGQCIQGLTSSPSAESAAGQSVLAIQFACGRHRLVFHLLSGQTGQSNQGLTSSPSAESAAGQSVLALQSACGSHVLVFHLLSGQSIQGLTSSPSAESAAGYQVLVLQSACGHHVLVLHLLSEQTGQSIQGLTSSPSAESVAGLQFLVLQSACGQTGQSIQGLTSSPSAAHPSIPQPRRLQDSDIRDDAAMQRICVCLQKMFEEDRDVMVGMTQLQFGQYLGEPCYAAAATHLPRPSNLPPSLPQNWKQGDFDVLLIRRHYGLVVCEVKAVGDNIKDLNKSQQDIDNNIRQKLSNAVSQLDKAEAMLSHLVSDIAPGLRITKVIAFPNITARRLQQAISDDDLLIQDLCRCLGTTDPSNIPGLCLCCDQLSDPKTPYDVSSHVLRELGHWWQRRVAEAGPVTPMTLELYKTLVARFCGPATSVTVPCTSPPRVSVKTLSQAVWWTGECYTAVITLFPEQVHLLHTAPPTLFVAGPPGTGKTVVLLLMGRKWLLDGHPVYIVSTWWGSRAVCIMLYHLLLQTVKTLQSAGVSPGQPHLLQYDLYDDNEKEAEKAVNDLSQASRGGSLYVIADEVIGTEFHTVCDRLRTQVPHLHLWAVSCYRGFAPAGWPVEFLTRPLRSPPAVVREVEQDKLITGRYVKPYSERGVPDHTDGPPVRLVYHGGEGHSGVRPTDCVTCGREVASFLRTLRVGVTENVRTTATTVTSTNSNTTPPCLQWRDVLVLYWDDMSDDSGMVRGLQEADIPVRVMKDDDAEDVATARSDVVWVTDRYRVCGLERKVVVCLYDDDAVRLYSMSRCTSQLVIVYKQKDF